MYILLSPHLDDAVFSLGGLIHDWARRGVRVEIWTVCAGDPPAGPLSPFARSLHDRWGLGREAVALRRAEDLRACQLLGAAARHLDVPDCIYRRHPITGEAMYAGEQAIFGALAEVEARELSGALARQVGQEAPAGTRVFSPLGLGNHVDHQLVRRAAEKLRGRVSWYPDLPYVLTAEADIPPRVPAGWEPSVHPVSEAGQEAWVRASLAYASQISTFWSGEVELRETLREYLARAGGLRLWRAHGARDL